MTYVITQNCCKDASCVPVCPVDCIRPVGGATDTEMLYIDPESCIDCGACFDECPVDAIHYEEDLPPHLERFRELNAAYFARHPLEPDTSPPRGSRSAVPQGALRVAIVGAGPAACYAAAELIDVDGVEVDLFERLPTPFGLVRAGVAPDHQHTKSIVDLFERVFASKRFGCHLNVEIGRDLGHDDLLAHHHAVIYAVGAAASRRLGIVGEDLDGSHAAAEFVGWYNGHPDHAHRTFDMSGRRAVLVGNGNVALDAARMMVLGEAHLAATDIADHALEALRHSGIEEVVVLARCGIRDASFSLGEFLALGELDGVDVVIQGDDPTADLAGDGHLDVERALTLDVARDYAARPTTPGNKRITFRFNTTPVEIVGDATVEAVVVEGGDRIETSLVLRSIGYLGEPIDGLPHDAVTGIVPNDAGRVLDDAGRPVPGSYVTGWIKRGPQGVIGTNRVCAEETVAALWDDYLEGRLDRPVRGREALHALMIERDVRPVPWTGWKAIDGVERANGSAAGRPRVKFVAVDDLLRAGSATAPS